MGYCGTTQQQGCLNLQNHWLNYLIEARSKIQALVCRFSHILKTKIFLFCFFFFLYEIEFVFFFSITKIQLSQCNLMGCCPANPAWQKLQLNSSSKGVSSPLPHSIHLREWCWFQTCNGRLKYANKKLSITFFLKLKSTELGNNFPQYLN